MSNWEKYSNSHLYIELDYHRSMIDSIEKELNKRRDMGLI